MKVRIPLGSRSRKLGAFVESEEALSGRKDFTRAKDGTRLMKALPEWSLDPVTETRMPTS